MLEGDCLRQTDVFEIDTDGGEENCRGFNSFEIRGQSGQWCYYEFSTAITTRLSIRSLFVMEVQVNSVRYVTN